MLFLYTSVKENHSCCGLNVHFHIFYSIETLLFNMMLGGRPLMGLMSLNRDE